MGGNVFCQHHVRVASYNVKQFPANNNSSADLKKIIALIKPTILLTVELDGSNAVSQFLNEVMSPKYKASTEVNIKWGTGNECAVFYIDSLLSYLGPAKMIASDPRPIAEFKFVHKVTNDTLTLFGVHLKAYPEDSTRRSNSVTDLRNRTKLLNSKSNFIVCGDFNIFSSNESAFQKLIDKTSAGYFYDLLNIRGNWNNNSLFASASTYSSSLLNTRLDMILISQTVKDPGGISYVDGSFKIFGNDENHFNKAVTSGTNSWFPADPSVGISLRNASDHLPIYADFNFGVTNDVVREQNISPRFALMQNYPNPFNGETVINYRLSAISFVTLKVYDVVGREISTLVNELKPPGSYNFQLTTYGLQLTSGVYFYRLTAGNFSSTQKMILMK
jgi:endonuclease/exonuclease/phosphatase family metal-dependent hydrolase